MKSKLFVSLFCALGFAACAPNSGSYINALTGEECTPDSQSYIPRKAHDPGQCQGTSNGDNCDDLHSGKIDCIGDGNSGQGDDKKHNCEFPQPGCDENGCCDDDMVDPPGGGDDGDDGADDPGDDGDGDDGDDGTTPPDGDDGGDDGTSDPDGGTSDPEPDPDPIPVIG